MTARTIRRTARGCWCVAALALGVASCRWEIDTSPSESGGNLGGDHPRSPKASSASSPRPVFGTGWPGLADEDEDAGVPVQGSADPG